MNYQLGILSAVPSSARFLVLGVRPGVDPRPALRCLAERKVEDHAVVGLGAPLVHALGATVPGLRPFPSLSGVGVAYPATQGALWVSLRGADAGDTLVRARDLLALLGDGFFVEEDVLCFKYADGRDLSGYEDGTENPKDERAVSTAIVSGHGSGKDGGSFVAVQRWVHDLPRLERMSADARNAVIGRHRETNEELSDAPASAHVKRSAQESFSPPSFMLRRSMPWGNASEHGLYFVAYADSLDPFERVLRRMAGLDDGVVDALSRFTRAVSGGYYWCPPTKNGSLDLSAVGA